MNLAEDAILEKGYAATSIEELIAAVNITKSGFFYHFPEKIDLGKALLRRENQRVEAALSEIFGSADAAHEDPLEALTDALARYGAYAAASARPGCLAAAISYQDALFDEETRALIKEGYVFRRRLIRDRLERVVAARGPERADVNLDALADMAVAVLQGSMVLERARQTAPIMQAQMQLYLAYLRELFRAGRRRETASRVA